MDYASCRGRGSVDRRRTADRLPRDLPGGAVVALGGTGGSAASNANSGPSQAASSVPPSRAGSGAICRPSWPLPVCEHVNGGAATTPSRRDPRPPYTGSPTDEGSTTLPAGWAVTRHNEDNSERPGRAIAARVRSEHRRLQSRWRKALEYQRARARIEAATGKQVGEPDTRGGHDRGPYFASFLRATQFLSTDRRADINA